MKKIILCLLFFNISYSLFGDNDNLKSKEGQEKIPKVSESKKLKDYEFLFDSQFLLTPKKNIVAPYSPYTSSSIIMSIRNLLTRGQNLAIKEQWERSFWVRYGLSIPNNIINDFLMLGSHEINGHGYRTRSLGGTVNGYGLFPLFFGLTIFVSPVNGLGGYARPLYNETNPEMYNEGSLLITMAGNEANAVLANEILLKNFKYRKLDNNNYNLFCKAFTNLLGYIMITSESKPGDDLNNYIKKINLKHNSNYSKRLKLKTLRWNGLLWAANPITYTAVWSYYAYIFMGKKDLLIPHIPIGPVAYYPIVRIGLTPFGISYYVDNFINFGERTLLFSFNVGKSPFYNFAYGGASLKTDEIFKYKFFSFDINSAFWVQPRLASNKNKLKIGEKETGLFGFLIGPKLKFKVIKYLSLNIEAFYKKDGFIEGEFSFEGFNVRGGITAHF